MQIAARRKPAAYAQTHTEVDVPDHRSSDGSCVTRRFLGKVLRVNKQVSTHQAAAQGNNRMQENDGRRSFTSRVNVSSN